jgi:glycerophosphoryl diester phosphodiesterase
LPAAFEPSRLQTRAANAAKYRKMPASEFDSTENTNAAAPKRLEPDVKRGIFAMVLLAQFASASPLIVIAHRGASGYLPEHTLADKALAIGLGADFVEQDVVLTKDDVPIVTHEIELEEVTDIAQRFPGRGRPDGHFYAIDFSMDELRTLTRHERVKEDGSVVYSKRFPLNRDRFPIVTLAEEIEFVQGMNKSMGKNVGIYTEIKSPAWHRAQGKDITRIVLDTVAHYGYAKRTDNIYLQCFDADELKRARRELHSDLKMIQLIGENSWHEAPTDYDAMITDAGIADVATYAQGIGPEIVQLVEWPAPGSPVSIKDLARFARAHHLLMHPYTLRIDDLPPNAPTPDAVLHALIDGAKIDGLFSDFTDVVVRYRDSHAASR